MVAASYALIGCLVGGVLSGGGVLLGVRMGCRFRELPWVKCVAANWELAFEQARPIRLARCTFEVDLFKEGQLATGLRSVSVALRVRGEGKEEAVVVGRLKDPASKEPLWAIDLPARRWAHANAYAAFEGGRLLSGFRGANLLGQFPDGRVFDIAIVRRGNFLVSSKKVVLERQERIARRNLPARFRWHRRPTG
jgi:hypothetical protein